MLAANQCYNLIHHPRTVNWGPRDDIPGFSHMYEDVGKKYRINLSCSCLVFHIQDIVKVKHWCVRAYVHACTRVCAIEYVR